MLAPPPSVFESVRLPAGPILLSGGIITATGKQQCGQPGALRVSQWRCLVDDAPDVRGGIRLGEGARFVGRVRVWVMSSLGSERCSSGGDVAFDTSGRG
jgi:hypothetical protein